MHPAAPQAQAAGRAAGRSARLDRTRTFRRTVAVGTRLGRASRTGATRGARWRRAAMPAGPSPGTCSCRPQQAAQSVRRARSQRLPWSVSRSNASSRICSACLASRRAASNARFRLPQSGAVPISRSRASRRRAASTPLSRCPCSCRRSPCPSLRQRSNHRAGNARSARSPPARRTPATARPACRPRGQANRQGMATRCTRSRDDDAGGMPASSQARHFAPPEDSAGRDPAELSATTSSRCAPAG